MKNKIALLYLLVLGLTSCNTDKTNIFLDIDFGTRENSIEVELYKLFDSRDDYYYEVNINRTRNYCRNINIGNNIYKAHIYTNDDFIKTGSLRNYSYDFAIMEFKDTGNDTVGMDLIYKSQFVFPYSDLLNIKEYLDNQFGEPKVQEIPESIGFEKRGVNLLYETDFGNIKLHYLYEFYKKEDGTPMDSKNPVCTRTKLYFYSKNYVTDFQHEKSTRRKTLTPEEVLSIYFQSPKLLHEKPSKYYDESYVSSSQPARVKFEAGHITYTRTGFAIIGSDILECKGFLSVLDVYNDTIMKSDLTYKLEKPYRFRSNGFLDIYNNSYEFTSTSQKLNGMLRRGEKLRTNFTPTAIAFVGGEVVK